VESGAFRRDLYYRIKIVGIDLPPLRERREDVPLLVEHFVRVFNATQGKRMEGVTPDVMAVLTAHDFPGNVRELQNVIEHAFVLCREGRIALEHLPVDLVPVSRKTARGSRMHDAVRTVEAQAIV